MTVGLLRLITDLLFLRVSGVWPDGADGTDINAVCRSNDGSLLVSADDFGKVLLFSFPCCQPRVSQCTDYWRRRRRKLSLAEIFFGEDSIFILNIINHYK